MSTTCLLNINNKERTFSQAIAINTHFYEMLTQLIASIAKSFTDPHDGNS